ncbi:MAG: phosphatidate cytidylyltransferase [Thermanaerothrix sp.]|nr:phosphatidate cytidylyltransferase [Thermanaerothrix sp.]
MEGSRVSDAFRSNLALRTASGVVLGLLVLSSLYAGGWYWKLVVSVIAMGSLWEFYSLLSSRYTMSKAMGLAAGLMMLWVASMGLSLSSVLAVISLLAFMVLFVEVLRRQSTGQSDALANIGGTLAGVAYVILPWCFLILLREQTWGRLFVLTIFMCTWFCDVTAYFVGSMWGKYPLCDKVSGKKTWEGFGGGVLGSLFASSLLALIFEFPPLPLLLLGLLCGFMGQLGDLGESVLKREAGVKDSGSLIPGHGGLLDRFDSILVNSSLAFIIFEVLGR